MKKKPSNPPKGKREETEREQRGERDLERERGWKRVLFEERWGVGEVIVYDNGENGIFFFCKMKMEIWIWKKKNQLGKRF